MFDKPKTDEEIVSRGLLKGVTRLLIDIPTGIGVGNVITTIVPVPVKFGIKLCYTCGYYALLCVAGDAVDKAMRPMYDEIFGVTDKEVSDAASRVIHVKVEDANESGETVTA